jgi:hypothetical protein
MQPDHARTRLIDAQMIEALRGVGAAPAQPLRRSPPGVKIEVRGESTI